MRVVYVDSFFIINLAVNYLLLLAVKKICVPLVSKWRIIPGAVIGAVYAVATLIPGLEFMQHIAVKVATAAVMLLMSFGGQRGLLRISFIFFLVSAVFGGVVFATSLIGGDIFAGGGIYVPISARTLFLSLALAYGLLTMAFKYLSTRKGRGEYVKLGIRHGGAEVEVLALRDTGNTLRDPVSEAPIPVVEYESIRTVFSGSINEVFKKTKDKTAAERIEALHEQDSALRMRLMPYKAVGVKEGMLLAFRPDGVSIDGCDYKGIWVAISPTGVSDSGEYTALVNGDV